MERFFIKAELLNKLDYTSAKSYCFICLLNSRAKVFDKVVADILSEWCEINHVLHDAEKGSPRQRSDIDVIAKVVDTVQGA